MYYNPSLLQQSLEILATIIKGASISFFATDLTCIAFASPKTVSYSQHRFCNILHDGNHRERCYVSDGQAMEKAKNMEYYSYKCHAGLSETIIPLRQNEKIFAFVNFGKYRNPDHDTSEEEIVEYARKIGIDEHAWLEEYRKVAKFNDEEISAIVKLIQMFFDYATIKNIVLPQEKEVFDEIVSYLHESLDKDLTIEMLCERFYLSRRQLYKLFKNNTGKTVMQYVQDARINEAKRLIISTDLSLLQIAEKVGVYDYNYFIKIFKAKVGYTPKQFRIKL
jgi:AraC-like DNA-binding protein